MTLWELLVFTCNSIALLSVFADDTLVSQSHNSTESHMEFMLIECIALLSVRTTLSLNIFKSAYLKSHFNH